VTIANESSYPIALDFKGVIALGSSCGDEILNALAARQDGRVQVKNANQAIKSCLEKVAEDSKIEIIFL
jgi:hypothetical protein